MPGPIFFHGLESGPGGTKARWLAERYGAVTPDLGTSTALLEGLGAARLLDLALERARTALVAVAPGVVVGSSFGGAVALSLLGEGRWSGPTVLLAPASQLGSRRLALPAGARVVVIHGELDDTVPVEHSRELVRGTGAKLLVVPGGDHRLDAVLSDGTLAAVIDGLGAVPRSR